MVPLTGQIKTDGDGGATQDLSIFFNWCPDVAECIQVESNAASYGRYPKSTNEEGEMRYIRDQHASSLGATKGSVRSDS